MTVRLTAAQARRLGVDPGIPPPRVRRVARGPYHTRCTACRDEFTTQAAEDRHLTATGHARYELVLS